MIKGLLSALILILAAGIVLYFFIPSPLRVSNSVGFPSSSEAAYRSLARQNVWDSLSGGAFVIRQRLANTLILNFKDKSFTATVNIMLVPVKNDSVMVTYESIFPVINQPISKIRQYSKALELKSEMDKAMKGFSSFVRHPANIYGINIRETSTTDTFLVTTRFRTSAYPDLQLIYEHISNLKEHADSLGAAPSGFPMLHVSGSDSIGYKCMVAVPVNKKISGHDSISFVRMVPGKFISTEVKGGPLTIRNAHNMMELYFNDFKRVSMAVPFEYLVTNRLKEPDTAKWVSRIYYPVY